MTHATQMYRRCLNNFKYLSSAGLRQRILPYFARIQAQLGGSCTLIGSSHCLVARESVDKTLYEMSFFDLSYSGTILCLSTFVLMALSLPFLASSAAAAETVLEDDVNQENLYLVKFTLRRGSSYVGLTFELASIQLKRLPGVRELVRNPAAGDVLKEDEELKFLVDETGVTSLRQIKGLCISSEDQRGVRFLHFVHFVSLVGMIHKVLWSQRSHDESWVVCHKGRISTFV